MERIDMLLDPVKAALMQIAHFLPKLAVAVVVVLIGWLLARVVRFAVVKGLAGGQFSRADRTRRAGRLPARRRYQHRHYRDPRQRWCPGSCWWRRW